MHVNDDKLWPALEERLRPMRHLPGLEGLSKIVGPYLGRSLEQPALEMAQRPSKHFRARLVQLVGQLVEGPAVQDYRLATVAEAVEILHLGSLIIDDIQDNSPSRRGGPSLHRIVGTPLAMCTGNWLYFRPLTLIGSLELPKDLENIAFRSYYETLELAHMGQALDLNIRAQTVSFAELPDLCEAVSELKTGTVTALAMNLAALVSGAQSEERHILQMFGRRFGTILQHCDDLGNLTSTSAGDKRYEDLLKDKLSGVWKLASQVAANGLESLRQSVIQLSPNRPNNFADIDLWLARYAFKEKSVQYLHQQIDQMIAILRQHQWTDQGAIDELHLITKELLYAY